VIIAVLVPESHRVRLPYEPTKLWTAIPPNREPVDVPEVLIHHQNAFVESAVHDWSWRNGELRYFSRCVDNDEPAWIFVEVPDKFDVDQFWKTREGEVRRIVKVDQENHRCQVRSVCADGYVQCNFLNGRRYPHGEIEPYDLVKFLPDFTAEAGKFVVRKQEPADAADGCWRSNAEMKPQRFRWISKGYSRTKDGCCAWNATNQFWEIHTFGMHKVAYFETSPVEEMKKLIGPVQMFEWLDSDFKWEAVKPE
jgi:hypothetical protein